VLEVCISLKLFVINDSSKKYVKEYIVELLCYFFTSFFMSHKFCSFCKDKFVMSGEKTALPHVSEYHYDYCRTSFSK
jgi:hypothetical protein